MSRHSLPPVRVDRLDCPSAQPDMTGARPFGVIQGKAQELRIAFFKKSTLDGFDWRARFSSLDATQIFRFAARCEEDRCSHFDGERCSLGRRVRSNLPPVVDALPPCLIRATCRWFDEQGGQVCLRCPQVISMIPAADGELNELAVARPESP